MALRPVGSVFVVFLCSVTVVLGQDGYTVSYTNQRVCVLRGSSVDLPCSYTYRSGQTVTATEWWTKKSDEWNNIQEQPKYAGRVEYRGDTENDCTLRITDLRETDSATYSFWFKTNSVYRGGFAGLPLTVTDLRVKVTPSGQNATLTCSATCPLTGDPSYIWYKHGHLLQTTSQQISVVRDYYNSYSCAVEGHEDLRSPTECVRSRKCRRVSYYYRRMCVLKGSSVHITCYYPQHESVRSTFWFSPERRDRWRNRSTPEDLAGDPEYAGRVQYFGRERHDSTLRITDLTERDSAEYRFIFKMGDKEIFKSNKDWGDSFPGTILTVAAGLQVKVTLSTVTDGQNVTLTCSSTCPLTGDPSFIWYHNGQYLLQTKSNQLSLNRTSYGSYSCAVEGREDLRSPAVLSPWTPPLSLLVIVVVVVVSVLAAGALLVLLWCTLKRRPKRGSDVTTADSRVLYIHQSPTSPQGVQTDPSSHTYTALHMRDSPPDYDTLASASGTNTGLQRDDHSENIKERQHLND